MAATIINDLGVVFKTQAHNARVLTTSMTEAELGRLGRWGGIGAMAGGLGGGMIGAISPGDGRSRTRGAARGMFRGATIGAGIGIGMGVPWGRWGR